MLQGLQGDVLVCEVTGDGEILTQASSGFLIHWSELDFLTSLAVTGQLYEQASVILTRAVCLAISRKSFCFPGRRHRKGYGLKHSFLKGGRGSQSTSNVEDPGARAGTRLLDYISSHNFQGRKDSSVELPGSHAGNSSGAAEVGFSGTHAPDPC